jgi:hypothetical protein
MARKITIDCGACGARIPLERGKEALISDRDNEYHLVDLCPQCLDALLARAVNVNDTEGFRQKAAALVRLPQGAGLPQRASG